MFPAMCEYQLDSPKGERVKTRWANAGHRKVCTDRHYEIFISPELRDTIPIIGVVAHELVHLRGRY
jgi:hypothetical protein